jgi:hypothetical protein
MAWGYSILKKYIEIQSGMQSYFRTKKLPAETSFAPAGIAAELLQRPHFFLP